MVLYGIGDIYIYVVSPDMRCLIIEMRCIFDIYWLYLCYILNCKNFRSSRAKETLPKFSVNPGVRKFFKFLNFITCFDN